MKIIFWISINAILCSQLLGHGVTFAKQTLEKYYQYEVENDEHPKA